MRVHALRARPRRRGLPVDTGSTLDFGDRAQRPGSAIPGDRPESEVGRRLHLPLDGGRLAVCRCRARPVLTSGRRLVDAERHDQSTRHRCVDDGGLAARQARRLDASLESAQYPSDAFQRLLGDLRVTGSMSRSGNVWDNSAMESFFSSLKTERTARKVYRSRSDAKADVFDDIERFYNPTRRHSTLGCLSPIQYEQQMQLA